MECIGSGFPGSNLFVEMDITALGLDVEKSDGAMKRSIATPVPYRILDVFQSQD